MGFKNLTKYVFTCCELYVFWQLVPQSGSWCSVTISLLILQYGFLVPSNVNRTQIGGSSLVYASIRSLRYTGAVPFSTLNVGNRILYNDLKRTRSQCSWNKTGVIGSLLLLRVTRRVAQLCTRCRWFVRERGGYYIVMHCHSQSINNKGLD